MVANGLCKLGVGAAAQDDNVSNHYDKQAGSWMVRLIPVDDTDGSKEERWRQDKASSVTAVKAVAK